jgi:hypothetical protein
LFQKIFKDSKRESNNEKRRDIARKRNRERLDEEVGKKEQAEK